jgi:poly-gamma-glutamate synthesis protein (capsule biosynthesis protein)
VQAVARFGAVGDIISHGDVLLSAAAAERKDDRGNSLNRQGYDALFEAIGPDLADAGLVFANLETPIAPRKGQKTRAWFFNAPPALLEALRAVGIRALSFANNHAYDQGRAGFEETLVELDRAGILLAGAGPACGLAQSARLFEHAGVRVAFLAASALYNQRLNVSAREACAAELDEQVILRAVAAARKGGAELVVLSLHWGVEYRVEPRPEDVLLAHRLVDGGVDVILGHHPHVLQPVELYPAADGRLGLIAYSLGNFVSNQARFYAHGLNPLSAGNPRDGVLLRFAAVRRRYGPELERVELADVSVQPLWNENNALERRRDPRARVRIRVVADDREAALARRALEVERDPERRIELMKRVELFEVRRSQAASILGEDLLRDPVELPPEPPAVGPVSEEGVDSVQPRG